LSRIGEFLDLDESTMKEVNKIPHN
jgi:hypothetical protein